MSETKDITSPEQLQIESLESVARHDAGLRKKLDATLKNRASGAQDEVILNYFNKAKEVYDWPEADREKNWKIYKQAFLKHYLVN